MEGCVLSKGNQYSLVVVNGSIRKFCSDLKSPIGGVGLAASLFRAICYFFTGRFATEYISFCNGYRYCLVKQHYRSGMFFFNYRGKARLLGSRNVYFTLFHNLCWNGRSHLCKSMRSPVPGSCLPIEAIANFLNLFKQFSCNCISRRTESAPWA